MSKRQLLGSMVGSSLDGIDICAVNFNFENGLLSHELLAQETYPIPTHLLQRIQDINPLEESLIFLKKI